MLWVIERVSTGIYSITNSGHCSLLYVLACYRVCQQQGTCAPMVALFIMICDFGLCLVFTSYGSAGYLALMDEIYAKSTLPERHASSMYWP